VRVKANGEETVVLQDARQMLDKGRPTPRSPGRRTCGRRSRSTPPAARTGCTTTPTKDHTFIVLQGSARYYDADGGHTDVGKHEGSCCPPAVLLVRSHEQEPLYWCGFRLPGRFSGRFRPAQYPRRGQAGDSKENKRVPVVVRDGEFSSSDRGRDMAIESQGPGGSTESSFRPIACDGAGRSLEKGVPEKYREAAPLFPPHKLGEGPAACRRIGSDARIKR